MSTIILEVKDWLDIRDRIRAEHGDSMVIISYKLKRELGFTVRSYSEWRAGWDPRFGEPNWGMKEVEDPKYLHEDIRLDFYDDALETMFRLKYL